MIILFSIFPEFQMQVDVNKNYGIEFRISLYNFNNKCFVVNSTEQRHTVPERAVKSQLYTVRHGRRKWGGGGGQAPQ